MNVARNILLWASRNDWMRTYVPRRRFIRRAVKRFMPGETAIDAIEAAKKLLENNIPSTLTHLGENISDISEAEKNTNHYLNLLEQINNEHLDIEISLKLTQIGFDLSFDKTFDNFNKIAAKAKQLNNNVFIDIEDSSYTDTTIDFYKKVMDNYDNVGLCLQAYLYRTMDDIRDLISLNPWIRLVKGAYKESENIAFKNKKKVDENFFELSKYLMEQLKNNRKSRIIFGTHDTILHIAIIDLARQIGISNEKIEFQLLYGIKSREQLKLAQNGYNIRTLISYGEFWFPWYMRRLAERPANVVFILKNIFR
jgi:proline dehydrogenase